MLHGDELQAWSTGKSRPRDLYAVFYLLTEKPASRLVLKQEGESRTSGDGLKPLQVTKYKVTDEEIRETMEKLVNTSMTQGQGPNKYFMEKTLARADVDKMDEAISDRRFKSICIQTSAADYKDIKLMLTASLRST